MSPTPLFLSPAMPSELLLYVVNHCAHPTTVIICSSQTEFLTALIADIIPGSGARETDHDENITQGRRAGIPPPPASPLLSAPLYQVAIARHIRLVFVPTVSHLRAFLSIFSPADSKVPAPPVDAPPALVVSPSSNQGSGERPLLLVYGFLDLHRDTSEWGAQGLSSTAATLVETARNVGFQAVVSEPRRNGPDARKELGKLLAEELPVLGGSARRMAPDMDEAEWTGRTVEVRRVLARWFRFRDGQWDLKVM